MTRAKWSAIGVAVYAMFLVTAPFLHHDLACELKNPRHCTSCTSSVLGADPSPSIPSGAWHLPDAGRAIAEHVTLADLLLAVRTTGRSPPSAAL